MMGKLTASPASAVDMDLFALKDKIFDKANEYSPKDASGDEILELAKRMFDWMSGPIASADVHATILALEHCNNDLYIQIEALEAKVAKLSIPTAAPQLAEPDQKLIEGQVVDVAPFAERLDKLAESINAVDHAWRSEHRKALEAIEKGLQESGEQIGKDMYSLAERIDAIEKRPSVSVPTVNLEPLELRIVAIERERRKFLLGGDIQPMLTKLQEIEARLDQLCRKSEPHVVLRGAKPNGELPAPATEPKQSPALSDCALDVLAEIKARQETKESTRAQAISDATHHSSTAVVDSFKELKKAGLIKEILDASGKQIAWQPAAHL